MVQNLNWHKDEVQKGGKVTILRKGFLVTDQISGTPAAGDVAFVADNGKFADSKDGTALACGQFLSSKDADGYAKVSVNFPISNTATA